MINPTSFTLNTSSLLALASNWDSSNYYSPLNWETWFSFVQPLNLVTTWILVNSYTHTLNSITGGPKWASLTVLIWTSIGVGMALTHHFLHLQALSSFGRFWGIFCTDLSRLKPQVVEDLRIWDSDPLFIQLSNRQMAIAITWLS